MEKTRNAFSGYVLLIVEFLLLIGAIVCYTTEQATYVVVGIVFTLLFILILPGFFIVNPNESMLLILFGEYKGTIKKNGFFWVNPFNVKRKVSLRASNFDSDRLKVNDKLGNPVMISVILVWRVKDTYKAVFEVDDYKNFVKVQTDAAVRHLAGSYAYDNIQNDNENEITLRSGLDEVNDHLENEIAERLEIAGVEILEARIGYLAYAEEIAAEMLRKQQAAAIVAARFKIVEGAVLMVQDALVKLSENNIVELDEEKKATMVSNLMVVLCGDKNPTPVINTGSIYS